MKIFKLNLLIVLSALFILMLASCQTDISPAETEAEQEPVIAETGEAQIEMRNTMFNPDTLTIEQGTTVTWTNEDNLIHTVTSGTRDNETGIFDSGDITRGETFSYTFNEIGTFEYFCRPHIGMKGTIEVE
ncbi:MAG: cupredoxin domain-containing protein [Actinomycetota bacterium]